MVTTSVMNNKNELPACMQFYLQAGRETTMQFVVALSFSQSKDYYCIPFMCSLVPSPL